MSNTMSLFAWYEPAVRSAQKPRLSLLMLLPREITPPNRKTVELPRGDGRPVGYPGILGAVPTLLGAFVEQEQCVPASCLPVCGPLSTQIAEPCAEFDLPWPSLLCVCGRCF